HFVIDLILHDDRELLGLLHAVDRGRLDLGFGETAVGEADFESARFLWALVDREAEARLQQQSRRQQQADDLFGRALGIVNRERQNRLVGLQAEVERRVANFLLR